MLKRYLDTLGDSEYDLYIKAKEEGRLIKQSQVGSYHYYIKQNDDSISIRIACLEEQLVDAKKMLKVIKDLKDKVYVIMGMTCRHLENLLQMTDFSYWHGTYELYYTGPPPAQENLHFEDYKLSDFDRYIEILGPAFADVRKACQLKPHDWFSNNRDQAEKDFKNNYVNNEIFSLVHENKIIGVSIIEDHHIELIAIDKAYQGQGFGKAMLRYWMRYLLVEKAYDKLVLGMLASNDKALKLYTDQGFVLQAGLKIYRNKPCITWYMALLIPV